jgi:hypothetical protein
VEEVTPKNIDIYEVSRENTNLESRKNNIEKLLKTIYYASIFDVAFLSCQF